MSDKIVIEGVEHGIDGEYDFDLAGSMTGREIHIIKRMSGVRLLGIADALKEGDHDLFLALGVIALRRHGKTVDEDKLWDAPAGCIRYVLDEVEEDAGPPVEPPSGEPSSSGAGSSPAGDASPTSSLQNGSGSPVSATGAAYVQTTSTT